MDVLKLEKVIEHGKDGLTIVQVIVQHPPLFYRGKTPLVFKSGVIQLGSTRMVKWSEFSDFRIDYGPSGKKEIPGIGFSIPGRATASGPKGSVLARAEVVELVKGSGFFIEEEHLGSPGSVTYFARSFFPFDGEKESESETRGSKNGEYFFQWPTGH